MKQNGPIYKKAIVLLLSTSLLILTACQALIPSTTTTGIVVESTESKPSEVESNDSTTTQSSESTSATTSETTKPPTTTTTTKATVAEKPKLEISLETIEENFVVWDGEEIVDEYSGSYMSTPVIESDNPQVKAEIEDAIKLKMKNVNEYWDRFTKEKEAALKDSSKRVSVVIHQTMNLNNSGGLQSIFSELRAGGYRSEYGPSEYFTINIDSRDGHVITYKELMSRFKLDNANLVKKANELLKAMDEPLNKVMLKPSDVNEKSLMFDGNNLLLLVTSDNPDFLGPVEHLLDLGPIAQ